MKKFFLTTSIFFLFFGSAFCSKYEIELNKAAETIKMEEIEDLENECEVKVPISQLLNNALLVTGDKIHVTGSGTVDINFKKLSCVIIQTYIEEDEKTELTSWELIDDSENLKYSIDITFTISTDATSGDKIFLYFRADSTDGLSTLTASKEKASKAKKRTTKKSSKKKNTPYSLDAGLTFPIRKMSFEASNSKFNETIVSAALKAQTYDFFWLKGHLGIYASLGIGFQILETKRNINFNGTDYTGDDNSSCVFNLSAAFGPSFGINIGSTGMRFNIGAGLHFLYQDFDEAIGSSGKIEGRAIWLGFDLNPQIRFANDKSAPFVFGFEMAFDTCLNGDFNVASSGKKKIKDYFDSSFQFMISPYVGLGFNF